MSEGARKAVLDSYKAALPHVPDAMPDDMPLVLLVRFRLGDLRELQRQDIEQMLDQLNSGAFIR